jgi:hypothetical protein
MSYFKSIMASRKEGQYGRLMHDDEESENSDKDIQPGFQRKRKISFLSCLLVSNTVLALIVVVLFARTFSQPSVSTISIPYTGIGSAQRLEDQFRMESKVVQTYRFYEENLDDFDMSKGDPYWAALFPSQSIIKQTCVLLWQSNTECRGRWPSLSRG